MSLSVGQRIELNDGRIASVKFIGSTHFQTGEWVGVELEDASGKNDGSVKGERYFECEQGYGMFLRPSGVRQVIEEPNFKAVAAAKPASNGVAAKTRPSSMHTAVNGLKRQSVVDGPGRRASTIAASPTPAARNTGGVRSPMKPSGSNSVFSASTSETSTPSGGARRPAAAASTKPRPSLAPASTTTAGRRTSTIPGTTAAPASRTARHSLAPPAAAPRTTAARGVPGRVPPRGPPIRADPRQRIGTNTDSDGSSQRSSLLSPKDSATNSSAASQGESDMDDDGEDHTIRPNFAPPPMPPVPPEPQLQSSRSRRPSSPTAASIHSQRTVRSTATNRQIEELEAKNKLLERKRLEDRDLRRSMEQAQQERDQLKGIIEKLQNKYRPQQQEIVELKQALDESENRSVEIEKLQAEHDSVFELATLDREMAEAKAEDLQAELDALRVRNEEAELELEILKEENGELSKEMSPEERTSAGWMQMEKSNERLREALLRLRDLTQDRENELRERIDGLEDQLKDLDPLNAAIQETRELIARKDTNINDLRQQLEAAEESEEMIEELSEQKNALEQRIEQYRNTIEELENLRELNDELEINHVEAEKQMLEEIDFKDSLILDRERTAREQQEVLDQADQTIVRFRTLVTELQSSLTEMQASKQLSETEAAELNNKSRAMIDLNMKLQSSAAKTQIKSIDLELRKLEAQEASEHLAIVQLFLPEAYHTERDSVLALLRFKRIAFKANVVHGFVKERVTTFGTRGTDEEVFAACEVLDELTWIAAMCERFINSISGCTIAEFVQYEGALYELEPVERALNGYLDGLRREELREKDMAEELQRSIAVMSHLASIHIKEDLASHADRLLMRSQCFQSQLESAASALTIMRSLVESNLRSSGDDEEDEESGSSNASLISNRIETLIAHARNAKVMAGKANRSLADLEARSLTLDLSCAETFDGAEAVAAQVSEYARRAGAAIKELFDEEGRSDPFTPSEVSSALARVASFVFSLPTPEAGPLSALAGRIRNLTDSLTDLASLPTDLDNTVEFERAPQPWVARANQLKQTKITSVDTEILLSRALESIREHDMVVKEKETELEEQSVRIEMLEARMKDASKRSAKIAELERNLHEAREGEKMAKAALVIARSDAEREIDRAREEMTRLTEERGRLGARGNELEDGAMGASVRLNMERQTHKIATLESAVRFLQSETTRLRHPAPDAPAVVRAHTEWIHVPLSHVNSSSRPPNLTLRKETKGLLQRMVSLAAVPQPVDLTKMPKDNKLAWRPAKETSRWQIEHKKETWEAWKDWRQDLFREGSSGVLRQRVASGRTLSIGETV